jgi:hypothetical protein
VKCEEFGVEPERSYVSEHRLECSVQRNPDSRPTADGTLLFNLNDLDDRYADYTNYLEL